MTNKYFKNELYEKWNMTEEQAIKEARKIKVEGLRLTESEKMNLLFEAKEFGLNLNNEAEKRHSIEFERKIKEDVEQEKKNFKLFAKTIAKLAEMSIEEAEERYYIGCYDYETIAEGIEYMGAKEYAHYWFNTRY